MKRIAIFGFNPLSYELAARLDFDKHQVTIADSCQKRVAAAIQHGYDGIQVDYRSDSELKKVGIGKEIEILFSFFPEDAENVFLTLSARALAPDLEIISVVEKPDSEDKLLAAGATTIINPFEISGKNIYERIRKPAISELMDNVVFGRSDLNLYQLTIPEGSTLDNKKVSELHLPSEYNLILIGIIDKELGEDLHFALGDKEHVIDAGDILVLLGPMREIRAFENAIIKH